MRPDEPCPCGTGDQYQRCCLPLHVGERHAETAEELMRSRYSAYAAERSDYIWATWHPRTRSAEPVSGSGPEWFGLEIIDVVDGQPGDDTGEVEFRAYYRENQRTGTLHERSRFAVRARRWFYLDGEAFG
ncbi:YchJ family protein [Mycolicibacterium arenosum]|uniref:UPF0225 protein NM203_28625 n=1 Tax=Mycolicibacterium arenosum TaxID=2952157 RepID=A0ABT1MAG6_9MYCO|nr:YchJ family metal-binding protein [Mycolicibacterium sp. CAU 1645]MCP9276158.1 YchJ family metal-binding protein [Mycolicibacterium sp. CAU 1645]